MLPVLKIDMGDFNYRLTEFKAIYVSRQESNFDRACDSAYQQALVFFEIDKDGHCGKVENYERSNSSVHIRFKSYETSGGMSGIAHNYVFEAWVQQYDDEET